MTVVGAFAARTNLSRLLDRVEGGERITIARHGKAVALLIPIEQKALPLSDIAEELAKIRHSHPVPSGSIHKAIHAGRRF